MKVKQELSIQTKDKLIQKILSLRSYCGKLKNLLTEYKATILLQQRGEALGSAFGGSGEFYATRRGIEKKIFLAMVIW